MTIYDILCGAEPRENLEEPTYPDTDDSWKYDRADDARQEE